VVARYGSITQAAKELQIAQPAISAHLAALEGAVGVRLFDRVGRGMRLNGAGAEFLAASERMLTDVEKLRQHADQLLTLQRGVVTVATSTTAGNYVAPHSLGDFHQRYPRLTVKLEVCNRFAVQQKILSGQADLAVMGVVEGKEQLQVILFLSNALVVVARPPIPWRRGRRSRWPHWARRSSWYANRVPGRAATWKSSSVPRAFPCGSGWNWGAPAR